MTEGRQDGLYVEDSGGDADRVVLLHSSGLSGRQWRRLADELVKRGARAVVPDLSGHGRSGAWPEPRPFSFRTDVDQIAKLLASEPAHVVGHSYGGFIALQAALTVPAQVRSLSLFEPTAFGVLDGRDGDARAVLMDSDMTWGPSAADHERWLRTFVNFWTGDDGWSSLREEARDEFRRVAWVVREGVRSMLEDTTPLHAYAALRSPVLLLRGQESPLPARRVVERLGDAVPSARVVTIEGVGHLAPVTHGGAVNPVLLEALLPPAAANE
jgi:pimeloyl-ACP methyl ester carboxylesterase